MFIKSNVYNCSDVYDAIEHNHMSAELSLGECRGIENECQVTDSTVVKINDDKTIHQLFEYLTSNEPMDILFECDTYLMCTDSVEVYTLEVFDMVELDF